MLPSYLSSYYAFANELQNDWLVIWRGHIQNMLVNSVVMPLQVMITSTSTKFQCVFVCWVAWYPFASLLPWFCFFACLLFARVISCCSVFCILHFDWLVVWLRVWLLVCLFVCLLVCLFLCLPACLPGRLSVFVSVCQCVSLLICICLFVRSFVEPVGELRRSLHGWLFCSLPASFFAWLLGSWLHLVITFSSRRGLFVCHS